MPTWGQFLDTCHHWHQYRDPHAVELLQHTTTHQLQEAQQAANDEGHRQYKEWLKQGQAKGLRRLFRSLKSSEAARQRSYRNIAHGSQTPRLGSLWQIRQDAQPHERPSLRDQAQHQAKQLEQITIGQLAKVLQGLPDKAIGPGAVSAQLLRSAPPLSLGPLLKLLQDMETPTRLPMHMVVMLPKNTNYRVWCRLRKLLLDQWQHNLPDTMNHDRARPGANILEVALERLLRQEVHKATGQHGVTVLMDMSTFYDTIHLTRLQEEALQLQYPPLMLEMAMQVYTGPKSIVAEQEMTPFFFVNNGVPAGCPQAPLLAKAILAPALTPWKAQHPKVHLSSWVDTWA